MFHFISIPRYCDSRQGQRSHTAATVSLALSGLPRRLLFWRGITVVLLFAIVWGTLPGFVFHLATGARDLALQSSLCLILGLVCVFINSVASLVYLVRRSQEADRLAAAAARIAVVSTGIAVLLAMASAHKQFNVWWRWSASSTTSVFALVIYTGYLTLRKVCDPGRTQLVGSVFAIFAFIDVPFIYVAVRLRLSGSAGLSELFAARVLGVLFRTPQLWNALGSLVLIALILGAEYRLLSIHQESKESIWAQRSSSCENHET